MTATIAGPPPAPDLPADPWRRRIRPALDARTGRDLFGWGRGWVVALLVGLIAGLLRIVRLDLPAGRMFDEIYYSCDAQNLLRYGVEHAVAAGANCDPTGTGSFIVHPPLGKWAIAVGLKIFGVNEFGWRIGAAVAGTLMVIIVVRVGRRMTGSTMLGGLAGLLLSLDGLHFVQSRIAMLDIFLSLWITAGFACLVLDRDAVRRQLARTLDVTPSPAPSGAGAATATATAGDGTAVGGTTGGGTTGGGTTGGGILGSISRLGGGPPLGMRPWRLAAGLCLGAALATKWSALYYIAALLLLTFAWEVGARRTAGAAFPVRATLIRSSVPLVTIFLLLPVAIYLLSWIGWFRTDIGWSRNWALAEPQVSEGATWLPDGLRSWWHYHVEMFNFHDDLTTKHSYQSHPIGWLLLARPVSYYYPAIAPGQYGCEVASCAREVLGIGTPAIWWGGTIALALLLWLWVSQRDWRAASLLALVAVAIVPWVRDDLDGRTMFLFYALPAVPFLCLGLTLVAGWALGGPAAPRRRRRLAAGGIALYLATVIVNFAYLYPVLAAQTIPYDDWRSRMWFSTWI